MTAQTILSGFGGGGLPLMYYRIRNWGDLINPHVAAAISGQKIRKIDIEVYNQSEKVRASSDHFYMAIGSILHHADSKTSVWGSGLISPEYLPKEQPMIAAVRGHYSAKAIKEAGYECSDVYGDAALLLPELFPNKTKKQYALGIIPHNDDSNFVFSPVIDASEELLKISLRGGFKEVLEQIQQCSMIVSSSLHGLIVADAYGIPSRRLVLHGALKGGNFKFNDYYSSIGYEGEQPVHVDNTTTMKDLVTSCTKKELQIDLARLMDACPF